ncbi:MAG: hypothetical protein ACKUBY_05790 [Candidatus Moraniibacteriota bacterium]
MYKIKISSLIFLFSVSLAVTHTASAAWQTPVSVYDVDGSWGSADLTIDQNTSTGNEYLHEVPNASAIYDLGISKSITQARLYINDSGGLSTVEIFVSEDPDNFPIFPVISNWEPNPLASWQESPIFDATGRYIKFEFHDGGSSFQNPHQNPHQNQNQSITTTTYTGFMCTSMSGTYTCYTNYYTNQNFHYYTTTTTTTTTTTSTVDPQINELEVLAEDIVPQCGIAARTYTANETAFDGTFCNVGVVDVAPAFPDYEQIVHWNCLSNGETQSCNADRAAAPGDTTIIKTVSECECYEIGSEESTHPDTTSFLYSNNNRVSWDYAPVPDSEGKDCNVTELKMISQEKVTKKEDIESEFIGDLTNTQVVSDGNGMVALDYVPGTMRASTFGSVGWDSGSFMAMDSNDNTFLTGSFSNDVDFDATDGVDIHTSNGGFADAYLTKYNADGSYGWTRTFGGSGFDHPDSIVVNASGDIFMTGSFENSVDFDAGIGTDIRHDHNEGADGFLTKYNADGTYGWTRVIGLGSADCMMTHCGPDEAGHIGIDASGNVFIVGVFHATVNFDDTGGADMHTVSSGTSDMFLTRYNADGTYGWTRTFGGVQDGSANSLAVDSFGGVFSTGSFTGVFDFDASGSVDNHTSNGSNDVFLTRYNADGTYGWTRTFGATNQDRGFGNVIDINGDILIVGTFSDSVNFDTGGGSDVHVADGTSDVFLTKYATNGTYEWTRTFGAGTGNGVAVDGANNIYVSGYFWEDGNFDGTGGTDEHASNGMEDAFLTRYNADGTYGWTRTFGGVGGDYAIKPWVHGEDVRIIGMFSEMVNFDGTGGSDEHISNGDKDVFFTAYNTDGTYDPLAYSATGEYKTIVSTVGFVKEWNNLNITVDSVANTILETEILDKNCITTLIPSTVDRNIDLSGISTSNIEICLKFTFETTDNQITPKLDKWEIAYTTQPDNTGSDFTYKTKPDPSCDSPVTPPIHPEDPEEEKECKTDNIKEITKDSVTLRVEVDEEYADEKIKFKVEVENLYTNEKETIKLTDKPSDSGRVTLEIDNLEEDTQYRFKVSYQEDDSYEYCPHSKTATTEKTTLGPTKEIVNPECGESSKTYTEDESEFTGDFCQTGEVLNIPEFPNQGESSSWTCTNDDEEITCSASREEKEIVTPPVVQGGSDPEPPAQEVTDPPVQEPTKEQQKEKQYQAAAVVGLTTGTLIALASTTIPLFTTIPMAATDIFIMPFLGILARRKNEQNWGTVFEQTTKQPLPGVKLVLTDIEGFEIETTYSDQHGRFGFLTTNGTYLIHPEKPKYEEDLTHNHDSLYGDVYTGEALTIEENKVLATNIAMNALNINWNEYADKKVKSYTGTFSAIKKWSFIILFYVGFIATAAITYLYPSTLNYIFLSLYMALFIYDNFIKQKKYGTVTKHDKNPVPFAVVSLHNKETNQKTGFAVTDAIGRYYLLAENGDYNMKVKGQPISGQPFEKQGNINVRKGLVREDIKV